MTKAEAAKIVGVLMGYYPDTFKSMSDEQTKMFVEIWYKSFEDEPYSTVSVAVWDFIQNSTDNYMPRVGKIKSIITEHRFQSVPSETEAFEILLKARKKYDSYKPISNDDSYATLPDAIKKAIGSRRAFISLGYLDMESEPYSIERSRFMKNYRAEIEKEKKESNRPMWLSESISEIALPPSTHCGVKELTDGKIKE